MKQTVTEFQKKVYAAVSEIPRGSVSTYALVARRIGCGSARAVGQALRHNPFAPGVPCHRVIRSDLSLGGFMGAESGRKVARKAALLRAEGVPLKNGSCDDPSRLFRYVP